MLNTRQVTVFKIVLASGSNEPLSSVNARKVREMTEERLEWPVNAYRVTAVVMEMGNMRNRGTVNGQWPAC